MLSDFFIFYLSIASFSVKTAIIITFIPLSRCLLISVSIYPAVLLIYPSTGYPF